MGRSSERPFVPIASHRIGRLEPLEGLCCVGPRRKGYRVCQDHLGVPELLVADVLNRPQSEGRHFRRACYLTGINDDGTPSAGQEDLRFSFVESLTDCVY